MADPNSTGDIYLRTDPKYFPLLNTYVRDFHYKGKVYKTAKHLFQALKVHHSSSHIRIIDLFSISSLTRVLRKLYGNAITHLRKLPIRTTWTLVGHKQNRGKDASHSVNAKNNTLLVEDCSLPEIHRARGPEGTTVGHRES